MSALKLTCAEAARLNGSKSRGPRRPEGKYRSSVNAMKHGLAAETIALLPGENKQGCQALLTALMRLYRPSMHSPPTWSSGSPR